MDLYRDHEQARWVTEADVPKTSPRSEFARDRARVIHSAALRRLAATTQVLAPSTNDFVRNRLTHSMEVAQVGRECGAMLGCHPDIVETACLAHDLGHPPFGHNGEGVLARLAADIGGFEGNAQTFRVLTRLEPKRVTPYGRPAGLNLTRATLDACVKYPWGRGEVEGTHKFGYYADDSDVFTWVRDRDVAPVDTVVADPRRARSLESHVMDFADDVAYSVHDVEDALACGLIDPRVLSSPTEMQQVRATAVHWYGDGVPDDEWTSGCQSLVDGQVVREWSDTTRAARVELKAMTSALISRFVGETVAATFRAWPCWPAFRYQAQLVVPPHIRAEMTVLKALAAHYVMQSEYRLAVQRDEAAAIEELVRWYGEDPPARLDPVFAEDFAAATTDVHRGRAVIDQVASLSDTRAWSVARHVL